jgi:hypothetical protein
MHYILIHTENLASFPQHHLDEATASSLVGLNAVY